MIIGAKNTHPKTPKPQNPKTPWEWYILWVIVLRLYSFLPYFKKPDSDVLEENDQCSNSLILITCSNNERVAEKSEQAETSLIARAHDLFYHAIDFIGVSIECIIVTVY